MAAPKPILYATGVTILGFICLVFACTTLFLPIWGHFEDRYSSYQSERGYFGPWKVCKRLNYGREVCGDRFRFQVSGGVYISGILAMISTASLAIFVVLAVIQLAMITSRDTVVLKYKTCVILKLALSIIAALLALSAAMLFAIEIDESNRGFIVSRGVSFYLQIILVVMSIGLVVAALYDVIFTFRVSGDPTLSVIDITGTAATTINNPGFRDGVSGRSAGISMTDSSGKPYVSSNGHGSVISMNTTVTSVSNGSTLDGSVTRSPLRSSLKKPRNRDASGMGIQNPGFSGSNHSPRMNRAGSVKKVRIQTHSTEV